MSAGVGPLPHRPAAPRTPWRVRLLLPLLAVALTLLVGEVLCRLFGWGAEVPSGFAFYVRHVDGDVEETYNREDAALMWSPAPGHHDGLYTVSEGGFRVPDAAAPAGAPDTTLARDKALRVLCLGDSSTFGVDVPEALSYPRALERLSDGGVVVTNGGVTGFTLEQAFRRYLRDGRPLHPDVVTVYVGINDPVARFWLSDAQIMDRQVPAEVRALEDSWLLRLQLYRAFRAAAAAWLQQRPAVARVSESAFAERLADLAQVVREDGARLVVVVPPLDVGRVRGWPRLAEVRRYQSLLRDGARRLGLALVEVPAMAESAPPNDYFLDLVHPNARGHALLAQALLTAIAPTHTAP